MRPFSPPATATLEDEETTEIKNKSTDATNTYDAVQKEKKASTAALNMKDWPTNKQLSHRVYWIITAFICWAFFRKCYYSQLVGAINVAVANVNAGLSPNAVNPEAVAKATSVTHGFKHLLPFGFVGSIVTGALTNKFGVVCGLIIVNAWATILFGLTSIGVLALQWPAIMFFNLFQGFIFGMMYAYLGAFFGFASLGTLQGCIKIFTGGLGLLFTPFYKHVMPLFPDVLWANRVLFIGSCLAFLLPLWLIVSPPEEEVIPSTETVEAGAKLRRSTMPMHAVGGPHSCFAAPMLGADLDRTSMMVIAKEARETRSRLNPRA